MFWMTDEEAERCRKKAVSGGDYSSMMNVLTKLLTHRPSCFKKSTASHTPCFLVDPCKRHLLVHLVNTTKAADLTESE